MQRRLPFSVRVPMLLRNEQRVNPQRMQQSLKRTGTGTSSRPPETPIDNDYASRTEAERDASKVPSLDRPKHKMAIPLVYSPTAHQPATSDGSPHETSRRVSHKAFPPL